MIDIDVLITRIPGLHAPDLERWIANDWVRPARESGAYLFHDIDVARVQLICELRSEMQIDEEVLPVVLSLLDQLYGARRQMRELAAALELLASHELRQALVQHLTQSTHPGG